MITINYRDPRPIYEQIQTELRRLMLTGVLPPGSRLPSVRELAGQLAINPNTIQRAYESLEAEGYLTSQPGKGSFAAPGRDVNAQRREDLLRQFDRSAAELLFLGLSPDELARRVMAAESVPAGVKEEKAQ